MVSNLVRLLILYLKNWPQTIFLLCAACFAAVSTKTGQCNRKLHREFWSEAAERV